MATADEPVPLDKLPKPVVEALQLRFPKAKLAEASKSLDDGKAEFVVSLKENGKEIDVTLTAEGAITFIEKEIAERELPKAVAAAAFKKAPKAAHEGAWVGFAVKEGKEQVDHYRVELLTAAKRSLQLEIAPDGTITQVVREIAIKDLPKAVSDAVMKKYPKAEYKLVEVVAAVENGKEVPEYYSIEIQTADKKVVEMDLAPDGSIESEVVRKN